MRKAELETLKANLKQARRMLRSSPKDQRDVREEEVQKLEVALKRAESQVNRDVKEEVEHAALNRVRYEEKRQRKEGKGAWFMKNGETSIDGGSAVLTEDNQPKKGIFFCERAMMLWRSRGEGLLSGRQ